MAKSVLVSLRPVNEGGPAPKPANNRIADGDTGSLSPPNLALPAPSAPNPSLQVPGGVDPEPPGGRRRGGLAGWSLAAVLIVCGFVLLALLVPLKELLSRCVRSGWDARVVWRGSVEPPEPSLEWQALSRLVVD